MTRIVCVGITVLDRIWYLDDLPKEGGKYVAKDYTEVGGGPAATAAVAAAKLGAEVDFIGRVGDDDTGRRLLAELESLGEPDRRNRRCWWTQAESALLPTTPAPISLRRQTGCMKSTSLSGTLS